MTIPFGDFQYTINNDDYTAGVASCSSTCPSIINIPNTITYSGRQYTVTDINYQAFFSVTSITNIILPAIIKNIEISAFDKTFIRFSPNLPSSLKSIKNLGFASCLFSSITIPSSIEFLGDGCFGYNPNLIEIKISDSNPNYFVVNKTQIYTKNRTTLVIVSSNVTSIVIDIKCQIILRYCFSCTTMKTILIPPFVYELKRKIAEFSLVENLILSGNTIINSDSFLGMDYLKSITYFGTKIQKDFSIGNLIKVSVCPDYQSKIFLYGTISIDNTSPCFYAKCHTIHPPNCYFFRIEVLFLRLGLF